MRLHHVQVACPPGGEAEARRFYGDGLGLVEVAKPPALAARGGCWFRAYDDQGAVAAEIHVGVEDPFRPAAKAHPALVVDDAETLDRLAERFAVGRPPGRHRRPRELRGPPAVPRLRPARQPGGGAGAAGRSMMAP